MAQAKIIGSGWHNQSIRHSNARRFGRAGGRYAKGQIVYGTGLLSNPKTLYNKKLGVVVGVEKDGIVRVKHPDGKVFLYSPSYLSKEKMVRKMGGATSDLLSLRKKQSDLRIEEYKLQEARNKTQQKGEVFDIDMFLEQNRDKQKELIFELSRQMQEKQILKEYEELRRQRKKYELHEVPVKFGLKQHHLDTLWWARTILNLEKRKEFISASYDLLKDKDFKTNMDVPRGLDVERIYYMKALGYTSEEYQKHVASYD